MNKGILFGIGVGPGDPEMLTVKAIKCMKNAEVLVFPGKSASECRAYKIVSEYICEESKQIILFKPFPMVMNKSELELFHSEVCEDIKVYLENGKDVGFITIGDPTIYSTFSYVNQKLSSEGYNSEIVSGVSSINAVAGRLGISLADQDEMIHIIPGSAKLESTLDYEGTRIYMKSGKQLARLIDILKEQNKNDDYQVMAVANCGSSEEKIYRSIDEIPVSGKYLMTIVVKKISD